jgi:hypothetical protein
MSTTKPQSSGSNRFHIPHTVFSKIVENSTNPYIDINKMNKELNTILEPYRLQNAESDSTINSHLSSGPLHSKFVDAQSKLKKTELKPSCPLSKGLV